MKVQLFSTHLLLPLEREDCQLVLHGEQLDVHACHHVCDLHVLRPQSYFHQRVYDGGRDDAHEHDRQLQLLLPKHAHDDVHDESVRDGDRAHDHGDDHVGDHGSGHDCDGHREMLDDVTLSGLLPFHDVPQQQPHDVLHVLLEMQLSAIFPAPFQLPLLPQPSSTTKP